MLGHKYFYQNKQIRCSIIWKRKGGAGGVEEKASALIKKFNL
jgi:hypothetical protein